MNQYFNILINHAFINSSQIIVYNNKNIKK